MNISGKVIVVTGGASGIGEALCRRFAQEGAGGVVVADLNESGAKAVADELVLRGVDHRALVCSAAGASAPS